jgi:hypothetical protein
MAGASVPPAACASPPYVYPDDIGIHSIALLSYGCRRAFCEKIRAGSSNARWGARIPEADPITRPRQKPKGKKRARRVRNDAVSVHTHVNHRRMWLLTKTVCIHNVRLQPHWQAGTYARTLIKAHGHGIRWQDAVSPHI